MQYRSGRNLASQRWWNATREAVAELTGHTFGFGTPHPMFNLNNSPAWIRFLTEQQESGVKPKVAAKAFVEKFEIRSFR